MLQGVRISVDRSLRAGCGQRFGDPHLETPIYGGRFYALREEMKMPVQRRKLDSGGGKKSRDKVSSRSLPFEEWHWLQDFPIVSPIVTWAEWEMVQRRLARNKADATRNAKRTYWLRGMVFCAEDGRRLVGHFYRGTYRYECPGKRGKIGVSKYPSPKKR